MRAIVTQTEAAGQRAPFYVASTVGPFPNQLPPARTVRVLRPHRPAQVYWMYNELALRAALARVRPRVFVAPDFNGLVKNPFGYTVAILHDLAPLKLEGAEPAGARSAGERLSKLRWSSYYRKLRGADLIIARSRSVQDDAVKLLGLDEARIVPIAQGLDKDVFTDHLGRGPYAYESPYFIHVGGFNANKNQVAILEGFARADLRDVRLWFAGSWAESDRRWLEMRSRELGVANRVRHLGYVPERDLPSLYGNALGVVFPSLEEGYGLPVLEGMASGAPVITSDCSSMPEVAGNAAVLVDPRSIEAIGVAMHLLAVDPSLRASLRRRGLSHASNYSWERLTDRLWAHVDRLASRSTPLAEVAS